MRLILTSRLSDREIGLAVGMSKTTIRRYRDLAKTKRLRWKQLESMDPDALHRLIGCSEGGKSGKSAPDMAQLHEELQSESMTLQVWWADYRSQNPEQAYSYSYLAALLKEYKKNLPTVMRQHHVPGKRMDVDYSGKRPHYFDRTTGEKVDAELFVAVLTQSSMMFAMATDTQKVPDFIRAHVAALEYFGGVPQVIVPDNLKSAVIKPGRSPTIQRSYKDFARHYGVAILPARPYHPRDKATVESGVRYAQHHILARLNHQTFYSLDELNEAIGKLLDEANNRPMREYRASRRERFEAAEQAALKPLPTHPYVYAEWATIPRVPQDYHPGVDGHFYSVPNALVGQSLEARLTADSVEFFHGRRLVARHPRSATVGGATTQPAHQTEAHRAQSDRTPEGMLFWAKEAGPHVLRLVQAQLSGPNPFKGLPACDQLLSMARKHGTATLEAAAREALRMKSAKVSTIKLVLATKTTPKATLRSSSARGPAFYLEDTPC